jgi:hypothetical protein
MKRLALVAALIACGSKSSGPVDPASSGSASSPAAGAACVKSGCSGSVCTEAGNDMMTTCEMKPEYACYQGAECKVQADGKCGWTADDRLEQCLAAPPPL